MHCQLEYLAGCLPGRIRRALDELPSTLDATYERTLEEIKETNWEFARRLFLSVAVVSRPLRVEELAELLAFDFEAGQIPQFHEDWRLEDPIEAVLSTCSTLLSVVNVQDSQVIQFSHFSVKEFLTSARFAKKGNSISSRYHVSMTPAHTLVAQACLGILLHLDKDVTRDTLLGFPLTKYAAEHWFEHARFEGVSRNAEEGMLQMFDRRKPHLAVWIWISDPTIPFWGLSQFAGAPLTPVGTPLYYASFCGLYDVANILAAGCAQDVNSPDFFGGKSPLYVTSRVGHIDLARLLIEHGADATAQSKDGSTALHEASFGGHVDLARLLIKHGADAAAQSEDKTTPLHRASFKGHVDLARLLIDHGADVAAQTVNGMSPLHLTSLGGHMDLARLLIDHGANVTAQSKDGITPLHRASMGCFVDLARLLIEHGADAAARDVHGTAPLHEAAFGRHIGLARLLLEHGADTAAQNMEGSTPLHGASFRGDVDMARLLIKHGADVAARCKDGSTPLHRASFGGHVGVARLLIEHGADAAALNEDGMTPLQEASERGHMDLVRLLIEHGGDAVQGEGRSGPGPVLIEYTVAPMPTNFTT